MIKDLQDAIAHAKEKAEELRNAGFDINTRFNADTKTGRECYECTEEHEQLASWLEELKQRREADMQIANKSNKPLRYANEKWIITDDGRCICPYCGGSSFRYKFCPHCGVLNRPDSEE